MMQGGLSMLYAGALGTVLLVMLLLILKRVMREPQRVRFTPQPLEYLNTTGHCPDCNCGQFYDGPQGGHASNIMCANPSCESRFWFSPPFTPTRITNDKSVYRLNHQPQTLVEWGHIAPPNVLKFGRRK